VAQGNIGMDQADKRGLRSSGAVFLVGLTGGIVKGRKNDYVRMSVPAKGVEPQGKAHRFPGLQEKIRKRRVMCVETQHTVLRNYR